MRLLRRLLLGLGLALGGLVYVWIASVRSVGDVRRRKARLREEWRRRAARASGDTSPR